MPTYKYQAMDSTGKEVKDQVDAASEEEAQQKIKNMGYFVTQLAERVGPEGRWIHRGLTSSDVVDTALALQMRDAAALLDDGLALLISTIVRRAREERDTIMIGRTHGMHAEPTTMGAKMEPTNTSMRAARYWRAVTPFSTTEACR